MQLHFTPEEMRLVADVLLECASDQEDLLQMFFAHKLRFDCEQLDRLGGIVTQYQRKITTEVGAAGNLELKEALRRRQILLEQAAERIQEASAMV
jgi:hypothetical protein